MSWYTRIRLLRSRVKWPGWAMIVWSIFWWTPELYGKVDFWLNTAREIGGRIGQIAAVITSPWFNLALMLAGILWLCFVGESRYAIRHPAMPYVGWGLVGLLAFAFWSVLVAGYVATRVPQQVIGETKVQIKSLTQTNQQLQQKVEALEQQAVPRRLTDEQRKNLADALKEISLKQGFLEHPHRLIFEVIFGCNECRVFAGDIIGVWKGSPGWEIKSTNNSSIDPKLSGIVVGAELTQCSSTEAELISGALRAGGISHLIARITDEERKKLSVPDGFCAVFIGNKL